MLISKAFVVLKRGLEVFVAHVATSLPLLCLILFPSSVFGQTIGETKDFKEGSIYLAYDIDSKFLQNYAERLIDVINAARFSAAKDQFAYEQTDIADIVLIAKPNAILNGTISEGILVGLSPKVASIIETSDVNSDFCHVVRVDFETASVFYAFQSTEADDFDPRCLHVALAIFLGADFSDIAQLETGKALARLFDAL